VTDIDRGTIAAERKTATAETPETSRLNDVVPRIRAQQPMIVERWYANQFAPERIERFSIDDARGLGKQDASEHFLEPMLGLLLAYLETEEPRYRDVYLDERLRFAPHRADPKMRRAFFEETLPVDEDVIAAAAPAEAQAELRQTLRKLHAPLMQPVGTDAIKMLAVGDCLFNEVRVFLRPRSALRKVSLDMRCVYFSAALGKDLSPADIQAMMAETRFDLFAFSFFTYEGLPPYTALMREADQLDEATIQARVQALLALVEGYLTKLREGTDAPFLVHNVSGLPLTRYRKHVPLLPALSKSHRLVIDELNEGLRQMADGIPNVLLLDEYRIARQFGLRNAMKPAVPRHLTRKAYFHTARFGEPLADAYADVLASYRDLRKAKVLLVDFDNTLWGGVMADGIVQHRVESQQLLRRLKDAGMLLVALSKNDEKNIRWDEMHLRPEDFALLKISWNLKVQSIQEAAAELDLGIDSFVVIDDSAQERDLIASKFPKIRTLDATKEETWTSLERLLRFPNTRDTEESRARTELYRAQALRRREQADAAADVDYPSMMASLGLRVRFGPASNRDLDRLTELVQRTNQFNTTTIRYTKNELATFLSSVDRAVYAAEVVDKFGSFGLVAVIVLSRAEAEVTIDSFVMSCRAMGFGLEQAFLRLVLDAEPTGARVIGRFVPTDRNAPSARVFEDNGFRPTGDTTWVLERGDPRPTIPAWITVEGR
jgi:FkbH-like protein